jgi:hypothetical protein
MRHRINTIVQLFGYRSSGLITLSKPHRLQQIGTALLPQWAFAMHPSKPLLSLPGMTQYGHLAWRAPQIGVIAPLESIRGED